MMILVLRLMCGGFWMISYSIAIYKGIKEKVMQCHFSHCA